MNMQDFHNEVLRVMKQAEELFSVDMSNVKVEYNLRGRAAGQVKGKYDRWTRTITELRLRFNKNAMEVDWDDMLNDTIPHEVAHVVCYLNPALGNNHNAGWKRVCRALGGTGKRCHSLELKPGRKVTRYRYQATCGTITHVGPKVHKKIQRMANLPTYSGGYRMRRTGGQILADGFQGTVVTDTNGKEHFTPAGRTPQPAQEPMRIAARGPSKRKSKPASNGTSKAAKVRAYIREHYSTKAAAENDKDHIIAYAMKQGFNTKGAAASCVKANIPKAFG